MYLEQEYKFHFLSFWGQGGFKISNGKKKKIHAPITPPPYRETLLKHPGAYMVNLCKLQDFT